jgi:hypothetical protein
MLRTVSEVAGHLRVKPNVVRHACDKGRLKAVKNERGEWQIDDVDVAVFLESCRQPVPPPMPAIPPGVAPDHLPRPILGVKAWIYFVRAGAAGPVKIGFSLKPVAARIKTLQIAHHEELRVIGRMRGTFEDEQSLHRRFAHLHIRGEWFRPENDLLAYVATVEAHRRRQYDRKA